MIYINFLFCGKIRKSEIWNYLNKVVLLANSRNKGELSKLQSKNAWNLFLWNKIEYSKNLKFWSPSVPLLLSMPYAHGNQWGIGHWWHFVSRRRNLFELKFGELINLISRFSVNKKRFFTMSCGCRGYKEKAFLQLP